MNPELYDAFCDLQLNCLPPKSLWIQSPTGKLHILDWVGSGQTVLFLHGGGLSAHTWSRVCAQINGRYHCLAVDLRGHGDSDWQSSYYIEDHVSDISEVVSHLDKPVHLVGMSLGGVVSGHLIAALGSEKFHSLTLVDVAPGVNFSATSKLRNFMDARTVEDGVPALIEAAIKLGSLSTIQDLRYRYASLTKQIQNGRLVWKQDRSRPIDYAHILERLQALNTITESFQLPTLLARGGRSKILDESSAKQFVSRCPNGSYSEIANAGHSVQEDNPTDLTTALLLHWASTDLER